MAVDLINQEKEKDEEEEKKNTPTLPAPWGEQPQTQGAQSAVWTDRWNYFVQFREYEETTVHSTKGWVTDYHCVDGRVENRSTSRILCKKRSRLQVKPVNLLNLWDCEQVGLTRL